jgi:hypothetical protein
MAFHAHEKNPTAGAVKTPAPTRAPKDFGTAGGAYGSNQYRGASSTSKPGENVTSPLADNMRSASDDGQDVLGKVIAQGVKRDDGSFQVRAESGKPRPVTFGQRVSTPADTPKVPSGCGGCDPATPVKR